MADQDTAEIETPEEAVKHVRPLGVAQARQLEKLVDNDFNQVSREIKTRAQEMIEEKIRELKAQYHADKTEEYLEAARKLTEEHADRVKALIAQARADRLDLNIPVTTPAVSRDRYVSNHITISDQRLQAAISEATAEINSSKTAALGTLERQRLTALRRVLIASITSDAEKILNDIPSASELMVQAAAERAERRELTK